ncbi:MAG: hypothetical protein ACFE0O_08440 [Opitutales bacterium]
MPPVGRLRQIWPSWGGTGSFFSANVPPCETKTVTRIRDAGFLRRPQVMGTLQTARVFFFFLLFALLPVVANAQEAPEPRDVTVTAWALRPALDLRLVDAATWAATGPEDRAELLADTEPLALQRFRRSKEQDLETLGGLLVLDGQGRERARVALPPETNRWLLLLLPARPRDDPPGFTRYRIEPLPDDRQTLPDRQLRLANLTGRELYALIDEVPLVLEPGLSKPRPVDGGTELALVFRFRNRTFPGFANTLSLDPDQRHWILILPPSRPASPALRVRVLSE